MAMSKGVTVVELRQRVRVRVGPSFGAPSRSTSRWQASGSGPWTHLLLSGLLESVQALSE